MIISSVFLTLFLGVPIGIDVINELKLPNKYQNQGFEYSSVFEYYSKNTCKNGERVEIQLYPPNYPNSEWIYNEIELSGTCTTIKEQQ